MATIEAPTPRVSPVTSAASSAAAAPPRRWLFKCLVILGLIQLSYLGGGAMMHFGLPPHQFFRDAYRAEQSVISRWRYDAENHPSSKDVNTIPDVTVYCPDPDKTYKGYTLFMSAPENTTALVDMDGTILHKYRADFNWFFPADDRAHVPVKNVDDGKVCSFCGYLYPKGEMLLTMHGWGMNTPMNGYGLVKMDKFSNPLWHYSQNIHHNVEVGEDDKRIYVTRQFFPDKPIEGLEYLPKDVILDELQILEDKKDHVEAVKKISILAAFARSPRYSALLAQLERKVRFGVEVLAEGEQEDVRRDVMHTNHVEPLPKRLAKQFPMFKPGQILISIRQMDIVAVLDPDKETIVWAGQGPWHRQHDSRFLDNGHILVFDNEGPGNKASRVLEYDPATESVVWEYSGRNEEQPYYTFERGMNFRFPNGNTFIVDTHEHMLLEVSQEKKVVWKLRTPGDVNFARRYPVSYFDESFLEFLKSKRE